MVASVARNGDTPRFATRKPLIRPTQMLVPATAATIRATSLLDRKSRSQSPPLSPSSRPPTDRGRDDHDKGLADHRQCPTARSASAGLRYCRRSASWSRRRPRSNKSRQYPKDAEFRRAALAGVADLRDLPPSRWLLSSRHHLLRRSIYTDTARTMIRACAIN